MTDKKLKNPDLTRFGFYLYPKVYRDTMGFDKAHGLLFLDSRGRIDEDDAKNVGMIRLLNSASAVLYAINPVDGKYPNASELLKSLSLGSVAKQRLITKQALRDEFLEQCEQSGIAVDLLDKAYRLGVNKNNQTVYESKSGRYLVDENGQSHRDVEPQELLYAVNADGMMIDTQIEYCLESLFKFHLDIDENEIDIIEPNDFHSFVQTVVRPPPPRLAKMGEYTPIAFYSDNKPPSLGAKTAQIIDVLEQLEAKLMLEFDFDDDAAFERYFRHIYNRHLPSSNQGYKTNMPAPLLIVLLNLMNFGLIDTPHIFCNAVGNLPLLAGLIKFKQAGVKVTACERFTDKQALFGDFIDAADIDNLVVHADSSVFGFDGNIGYLPAGDEPTPVLIPDSEMHSYKKSIVQMLDILSRRKPDGRSIFIAPIDSEGSLGELNYESSLLVKHLYQNYQNVLIFDCNYQLSLPSRNNCEYRVFIIGELIEDYSFLNTDDLAELALNPKIRTVDTPNDFYLICAEYAAEIAAVEISSVDLMDNLMNIIDDDDDDDTSGGDSNTSASKPKDVERDDIGQPTGAETAKTNTKTNTADADVDADADADESNLLAKSKEDTSTTDDDNASDTGSQDTGSESSGGGKTKEHTAKPASADSNEKSRPINDRDNNNHDVSNNDRDSDVANDTGLDALDSVSAADAIADAEADTDIEDVDDEISYDSDISSDSDLPDFENDIPDLDEHNFDEPEDPTEMSFDDPSDMEDLIEKKATSFSRR